MTEQLTLFTDEHPLAAAFKQFHEDNPHVYRLFERFALQAAESGRKRFGAKMVFERMRWYTQVETNEGEYKLNNNYHAFYARMFEERHPEHAGLFEKRRSVADDD